MAAHRSRGARGFALLFATAATLLAGCGVIRAIERPGLPRPRESSRASCVPTQARAHEALAAAGSADPHAVAVAHSAHAVAMHEFHSCLASAERF